MVLLRVNLHNHLAPDLDPYWKGRAELEGKNLAEVMVDKSLEHKLTVNALTDEFFEIHPPHSRTHERFKVVCEHAQKMSKDYHVEWEDGLVIAITKKGEPTVHLMGDQSIWVKEGKRKFKLLTFGGESPLIENQNLQDTLAYLKDKGFPAIPIYPLSPKGMGEELLRRCCEDKSILAIDSESQMCLPWPAEHIPQFNQCAKSHDKRARKIASEYEIPIISSDGANWPTQISAGYNLFPSERVDLGSGEGLVRSLITIIGDGKEAFGEVQHYLNPLRWKKWAKWTIWEYGLREQKFRKKEKFYKDRGLKI